MPEGDALHRAARRLQPLVGERVEVETPNPRAQVGRLAERLDGRCLLSVEAVGKNLLLTFEGGIVLRSHLRMTGRWSLVQRGATRRGRPWLVLRGSRYEGVQWNGPVLELHTRDIRRLGPDMLAAQPDLGRMVAEPPQGRPGPRRRRCAARPAARRRNRQQVESGGALGSRALAVAAARRDERRGAPRRASRRPRARCGARSMAAATPTACTAGSAGRALAAASGSVRAARATPTGSPTGARPASADPACRDPGASAAGRPGAGPGAGDRDRQENTIGMTVAAPHLYEALRAYCLAAFALIAPDVGARRDPVRGRRAGRPLRVPAAPARLSRGACAPPFAASGREDRARRVAPRAGGGDLRARRR